MKSEITAKIIELYYKYYLINIYKLIHVYNCQWTFEEIPRDNYKYVNNTHFKHDYFQPKNAFLNKYNKEKSGLAKDLIENGCFFPFFSSKDKNRKDVIDIILGKHRVYSLMLYYDMYPDQEKKKFLIIEFPEEHSEVYSNLKTNIFYGFNFEQLDPVLIPFELYSRKGLLIHLFDVLGGRLSHLLFFSKLHPSEILNDENLFSQFINAPLDENNILFKYIPNSVDLK